MQTTFTRSAAAFAPALFATLLAGCGSPAPSVTGTSATPSMSSGTTVSTAAIAELFTPSGQAAGKAEFAQTAQGVEITIRVSGLTPGVHGFHVHANGACAAGPDAATGQIVAFGAAGGHFDPGNSRNHGQPGQMAHEAHAGELPNITVGGDGTGTLRYVNTQVSLAPGKTSVLGRTLVVHENADDYMTDPAGNSGGRALCGLIEPAARGMVTGRAVIEGSNAYPEGIAIDVRTGTAYVGSSSEGHIWRITPGSQKAEMLQAGGAFGRQAAYGMKLDAAGRLWVAGGAAGTVAIVDTATAATVAVLKSPPGSHTFLNDLVLAGDGNAYVTDSFRPILFRARHADGVPAALEPWLDLAATPIRYRPNELNLNGIVASPDGRWLLAIQLVTGQLWRIDTVTKAVSEVRVEGGDLRHGDGLVLKGSELYVLRNEDNEIVRLALADGWGSARVTQRITDPRLKFPTTAAATRDGLMVVNGQLNKLKDPPPLLPFDVMNVSLPAR